MVMAAAPGLHLIMAAHFNRTASAFWGLKTDVVHGLPRAVLQGRYHCPRFTMQDIKLLFEGC